MFYGFYVSTIIFFVTATEVTFVTIEFIRYFLGYFCFHLFPFTLYVQIIFKSKSGQKRVKKFSVRELDDWIFSPYHNSVDPISPFFYPKYIRDLKKHKNKCPFSRTRRKFGRKTGKWGNGAVNDWSDVHCLFVHIANAVGLRNARIRGNRPDYASRLRLGQIL